MGCNADLGPSLEARGHHEGSKKQEENKKPAPNPDKIIEKIKALQFQAPPLDDTEFLNVMQLDLTEKEKEQANFTFSLSADEDGIFYFSTDWARFLLQECTKDVKREYKATVTWHEVQKGGRRELLKIFKPRIDSFSFRKGHQYYFTYTLLDLKEFADCKAATLKFAAYYKKD